MSAITTIREDLRADAALLADFENRIARILADALLAELARGVSGAVVDCTPERGTLQ